ncbi:hypothetical protein N7509_007775 [Penicillium cosmopolitanum]|uniref:Yeast cell wall synthesis Kre9/Knh1-like N-terminal domain-containing protein n=1 Tax=Penicillium cosmopolitanum TaxID=1131564 RepID=A0A9X0B8N9_9EURO|nr:uncharacterized protein N7509_007775 [Penicillium cosmopolitanum]KAJ5392285.1 hypothetical protein N7509_007775 [Penicillium cosmopolitanum]
MRFIIVTSLLAALVAAKSTNNDFNNPAGGYTFTAGDSTTVTWDHKSGSTISLRLQSGSVTTATSGTAIASNIDNTGSFTWTVPTDLVKGKEYTIEIINDENTDDYNFLPYFTVVGATGSASTSTAAPTTTTSAESTSTTEASTTSTTAEATTTTEASTTTDATTTTTSKAAKTTATTLTKASSSAATTATTSSETQSSTSASSTSASSSASASSTAVPNGNGAGVNRVSGAMLALVAGAIAMM